jgi:Asp-tRNA(Asn)/Glu-tRNA(Gln) amidotransferase A subunit family amidase
MPNLCDLSATELRRLIATRQISPVALTAACIERIEAVDGAVNAMVTRSFERALIEARAAEAAVMRGEALGPLHGLPIGIKDLSSTAGILTTFGSVMFADNVPKQDERVVASIRQAGAIVVGKTNTPEFGAGGNTRNAVFGPTGNPYDPILTSGGSSGGSAVALATGMAPLASGSDFGGSLRTPSAFCGVVGFRPSPGVIPDETKVTGLSPFAVDGPMARNVADAHLLLGAMAGHSLDDPFSAPLDPGLLAPLAPADLGAIRVAFSSDLGIAAVDPAIRATFGDRMARLWPHFAHAAQAQPNLSGVHEVFETLRALFLVGGYGHYLKHSPDRLGPNMRDNTTRGMALGVEQIAQAFARQTRLFRHFNHFFDDYDVLIAPATSVAAFPHAQWYPPEVEGRAMPTYMTWLAITYGVTMMEACACCLPCGLGADGLPFGLQVIGLRGSDRKVLEVALALEQVIAGDSALAVPKPDLAKLAAAPSIRG